MFNVLGGIKDIFYVLLSMVIGMVLVVPILVGCTIQKFEVSNKITPKISIVNDTEVGLEYTLASFLILDVIKVNKAQLMYISDHTKNLVLDLTIVYDDCNCNNSDGFTYYLRGTKLNKKPTNPIETKKLIEHADEIPGFVWLVKDGKEKKILTKSTNSVSSGVKRLE